MSRGKIYMGSGETRELVITKLAEGLPGITPAFGSVLAEAAEVCFEAQNHRNGVELRVDGTFTAKYKVYWQEVTDQMLCSWDDIEYTTEQAACGVAFLLIHDLTEYTVIGRSRRGTGFDYWLGKKEDENEPPSFQNSARLEVSGIRRGNHSLIKARVKRKLEQMGSSDSFPFPVYIVIVEFSTPLSRVVKK